MPPAPRLTCAQVANSSLLQPDPMLPLGKATPELIALIKNCGHRRATAGESPFRHAKKDPSAQRHLLFAPRDLLFIIPLLPKLQESNQSAEVTEGNFGDQSHASNKE